MALFEGDGGEATPYPAKVLALYEDSEGPSRH